MKTLRIYLLPLIGLLLAFSAKATVLTWEDLGGLPYYGYGGYDNPHLVFSPISVSGPLLEIKTDLIFTAGVGLQNSDARLFASLLVDDVVKVVAETDTLLLAYGQQISSPIFHILDANVFGDISMLHFGATYPGIGSILNMTGTQFIFAEPPTTVPLPSTALLMLAGLGVLVIFRRLVFA